LSTAVVILLASTINAITGFGFALLLVPFLSLIFSPKIAVPVEVALSTVLNMSLFIQCRKEIDKAAEWRPGFSVQCSGFRGRGFWGELGRGH